MQVFSTFFPFLLCENWTCLVVDLLRSKQCCQGCRKFLWASLLVTCHSISAFLYTALYKNTFVPLYGMDHGKMILLQRKTSCVISFDPSKSCVNFYWSLWTGVGRTEHFYTTQNILSSCARRHAIRNLWWNFFFCLTLDSSWVSVTFHL